MKPAVTHAALSAIDIGVDELIRYQRPELPPIDEIARYYALAEDARFYSNGGPCLRQLSRRLADCLGGRVRCIPVANCTLGLIVALRERFGAPGGRRRLVAVPAFSFTATACAIRWAGFEPLFVDIDAGSWQLDPEGLVGALERHPGEIAGVLGCSTFGTPPLPSTREAWRRICAAHDLPLLLDSAAAFGAVDDAGGLAGSTGDTEVFSFHATKPFAIGEGGLIVTSDDDLADRLERAINFGIDPTLRVSVTAGLNAKMSELAAATALAMLDRFPEALARRLATAAELRREATLHGASFQAGSDGSTWQVFQLVVPDPRQRQAAVDLAQRLRIELRTCFDPPLHRQPAFAQAPVAGTLQVTDAVAARSLSLPMANSLGPRQFLRIAELLERVAVAPC